MRHSLRVVFVSLLLVALALLTSLASADGRVARGMEPGERAATVAESQPAPLVQFAAYLRSERYQQDLAAIRAAGPPQVNGLVTFDTVAAPCTFSSTIALRGALQGASFFGPGLNGGGILDECANFGVPAFSAPNFLATNPSSLYSDGGIPKFPQLIRLGQSSFVQMMAEGDAVGSTLLVIGLGTSGVAGVGVCPVSVGAWASCSVTSTGNPIAAVIMFTNDFGLIVDNIAY